MKTKIIEINEEALSFLNPSVYTLRNDLETKTEVKTPVISIKESEYIHVPSLNMDFSRQKVLLGKNWFETHEGLQKNGARMLTPAEFIEFLKYIKATDKNLYNEITEVRNPLRAEWLDADFKTRGSDLYINTNHVLNENGILVPKNSELLDKNTLMKDKIPGISLDDYIMNNHTSQGFPRKDVKSGDLYYFNPRSDNNSVARFSANSDWAYLDCDRYPSNWGSDLGVRAAKLRE